ncbi:MAG: PepSY domain-containing protein [Chloroflexi bacterium]|nr:PepSY domain-containing protein [Chloroflexota bacterium]
MSQRMAILIAGALTVFVLVLTTGVAVSVATKSLAVAPALPQSQVSLIGQASSATVVQISASQATQIALNAVPRAKLERAPELVSFQGAVAYEVVLDQSTLYVDANTGNVLFNSAATVASAPFRDGRAERHSEDEHRELEEHDDD